MRTNANTLADRLAAAQAAEQPLAVELSRLEAALTSATDRSDFAAAADLRVQVADACERWGLARIAVEAVQIEIDDSGQKPGEQALAAAQRRGEAMARRAEAQAREECALSEVQGHLKEVRASIQSCALALHSALTAEARAGEAHREAYQASADLGECELAMSAVPSAAHDLIERSTLLRAIRAGRVI